MHNFSGKLLPLEIFLLENYALDKFYKTPLRYFTTYQRKNCISEYFISHMNYKLTYDTPPKRKQPRRKNTMNQTKQTKPYSLPMDGVNWFIAVVGLSFRRAATSHATRQSCSNAVGYASDTAPPLINNWTCRSDRRMPTKKKSVPVNETNKFEYRADRTRSTRRSERLDNAGRCQCASFAYWFLFLTSKTVPSDSPLCAFVSTTLCGRSFRRRRQFAARRVVLDVVASSVRDGRCIFFFFVARPNRKCRDPTFCLHCGFSVGFFEKKGLCRSASVTANVDACKYPKTGIFPHKRHDGVFLLVFSFAVSIMCIFSWLILNLRRFHSVSVRALLITRLNVVRCIANLFFVTYNTVTAYQWWNGFCWVCSSKWMIHANMSKIVYV